MKTIRRGTFETNSSSCHSITVNCTKKELDEFNEGKRFYFYSYSTNFNKEAFLTLEEAYELFKSYVDNSDVLESEISSYMLEEANNYGVCLAPLPWDSYEEYIKKDFERFKTYFKDNLCFDMFKFALDDNYENPKYFSKAILRSFIQYIMIYQGCPLMSIENLRNTESYNQEYASDVSWRSGFYQKNKDVTSIVECYNDKLKDDDRVHVNIVIRD